MVLEVSGLHSFAAWRHQQARQGFEVVFADGADTGRRFDGTTTAVEDGEPWAVDYAIILDSEWATVSAVVRARSRDASRELTLTSTGDGSWQVNGEAAPHLDGCRDVDLEASVLTNAFPVRRLGLAPGQSADAPAAYVRAVSLEVQRLEQRYERRGAGEGEERYGYAAPAFDFSCELVYAADGLVRDYPGIAVRVG
jgi:hypothetical protein